MGKRCQKIFLKNVKSVDKLTEKSEYQVPMDGEEREVSRSNSETFNYVVHFTYRRETVSNNKGKNRISKREKRKEGKNILQTI